MDENLIHNEENKIPSVEDIINDINEADEKQPPPKKKRSYKRKPKKVEMIPAPQMESELQELTQMPSYDINILRKQLIEDLDIMCYKFKGVVEYVPKYTAETSLEELERQKKLFLRIVSEKASLNSSFECLLFLCRGVEKVGGSMGVLDIDGYATDIEDKKDTITEILNEMIDMNMLQVEELTPEIRLAIVMSNALVNRMEVNRAKKKERNITLDILEGVADDTNPKSS